VFLLLLLFQRSSTMEDGVLDDEITDETVLPVPEGEDEDEATFTNLALFTVPEGEDEDEATFTNLALLTVLRVLVPRLTFRRLPVLIVLWLFRLLWL
jgi:hypothetical protein